VPDPLPVIDGLLAASAKIGGWTLVTRNTADVAAAAWRCSIPSSPLRARASGPAARSAPEPRRHPAASAGTLTATRGPAPAFDGQARA
jgi:hypothetical protein